MMISTIMSCFSYCSFILFVCLSHIASTGFKVIGRQIRNQQLSLCTPAAVKERIKEWKQNHEDVCVYVHQLNKCFGSILLVEISSLFVGFIISLFYLVQAIQSELASSMYTFIVGAIIKHLISLVVICIMSENIKSQVRHKIQINYYF